MSKTLINIATGATLKQGVDGVKHRKREKRRRRTKKLRYTHLTNK